MEETVFTFEPVLLLPNSQLAVWAPVLFHLIILVVTFFVATVTLKILDDYRKKAER